MGTFPDKTPDELASSRLFPASSERTYEDKGHRWAAELGLIREYVVVATVDASFILGICCRERTICWRSGTTERDNGLRRR